MRKRLAIRRAGGTRRVASAAVAAACLLMVPLDSLAQRIGVTVLPLQPLVSAIAGEGIEVRSLQQEGDACGVFEPRPSVLTWMAGADVLIRTGVAYEDVLLPRLLKQAPDLRVVDVRGAAGSILPAGEATGKVHGEACANGCAGHAHGHGFADDPHLWLDPLLVADQVVAIASELAQLLPGRADQIQDNAAQLRARSLALHGELKQLLQPHRGKAFFIYHPALTWFAARYGLEQIAIAPSSSGPSPRELSRMVGQARAAGVSTIFVQPQENQRHAEIIAQAIGATTTQIDPMSTDWEANLLHIGRTLAAAFGGRIQ